MPVLIRATRLVAVYFASLVLLGHAQAQAADSAGGPYLASPIPHDAQQSEWAAQRAVRLPERWTTTQLNLWEMQRHRPEGLQQPDLIYSVRDLSSAYGRMVQEHNAEDVGVIMFRSDGGDPRTIHLGKH